MTAHRNAVRSLTSSGPQLAVDLSTAWDDFEVANKRKAMLFGYRVHSIGKWAGVTEERSSRQLICHRPLRNFSAGERYY